MMAQLQRNDHSVLIPKLSIARTFLSRGKGLLGRAELSSDEALWLNPCNSIHTFFMKMSIDCVFLDRDLKVVKLVRKLPPWRLVWPVKNAHSCIEMEVGKLAKLNISEGEVLHVVD